MMMKSKSVCLILVTILLVTIAPFSTLIHAQQQNQEPQSEKAQQFVELAMQAREKTYELRDFIREKIASIPDEIEDLLEEADTLLAEGSVQNTIRAMNHYRSACKHLHRLLEQHGVDTEAPEKARGILVAINRTYIRIERYNATLIAIKETLSDTQYLAIEEYVECVQGNLTEAKNSLALANESLWLNPPNVVWAAHNLTEANHNIQEAVNCMRMIAKGFNRWRMEHFLTRVRAIKEGIQERIRERQQQGMLGDVLEKQGYSSMEDFHQTIEDLIESAREHTEDMKNAIQDLKIIMKKLRDLDHNIPGHGGPP